MSTLKQLINNGLQVGQLVIYAKDFSVCQYLGKTEEHHWEKDGQCLPFNIFQAQFPDVFVDVKNGEYLFCNISYSNGIIKLTTCHDSGIDPDLLPMPEPFATGWVAKGGIKYPVLRYHYSGNLLTEIECSDKYNSHLSPIGCRPCLPPNEKV